MACAENNESSNLEIPLRSEIDSKYKWDLTAVYETDAAWELDLEELKKLYPKMGDYKGKLHSNPETLLESIQLSEKINQYFGKLYHYASNSLNADLTNEKYQEMVQRVRNVAIKSGEVTAYYTPEMLKSDYSVLEDFMIREPELRLYEKDFKDMYIAKPHILSEKEERILTMAGKLSGVPNEAYDIMRATDFKWGTFEDENGKTCLEGEVTLVNVAFAEDRNNIKAEPFKEEMKQKIEKFIIK